MRDLIVAIIAAILVSAGISYWLSERTADALREDLRAQGTALASATKALDEMRGGPVIVALQVYSVGGGKCLSSTDLRREVPEAGKVHWTVRRASKEADECFGNGETVKIVPKPGNTSPLTPAMPFDSRLIKADATGPKGTYQYEVWLADKAGGNLYMMEDPELEIIETAAIKK